MSAQRLARATGPSSSARAVRAAPGHFPRFRPAGAGLPPLVRDAVREPGRPLDPAARAFMEPRFTPNAGRAGLGAGLADEEYAADRAADRALGSTSDGSAPKHDFSRIRIHTDAGAARSAGSVGALAYTVGEHIVFAAGRYRPETTSGRHLLAHELAHTIQQQAGQPHLARQCDPAWAALPWSQRVSNAKGMAGGTPRNQCIADMIDEALTPNVIVEERTNTSATVAAAITANRYVEWGTLSDLHVNYDGRLNAKTGDPGQFGQTEFRTPPGGASIRIFIILGPNALDPVGPQHTQMAFDHENAHASDFLIQFVTIGSTAHAATSGEELRIHTEGFSLHFLDLWTINNTTGAFSLSNDFGPIFTNFAAAGTTQAQRDAAFDSIKMFFDVRCQAIPCNVMKFKIWLQMMQNARPAGDALIARLNAFSGMGLTRGTAPATHFNTALACS